MTQKIENKPINGNDLIALGYPENEILGIALKINKKRTGFTKATFDFTVRASSSSITATAKELACANK